ncbi:hypothetical protein Dimus_016009, partial [Dionaea muscipula]
CGGGASGGRRRLMCWPCEGRPSWGSIEGWGSRCGSQLAGRQWPDLPFLMAARLDMMADDES